MTTTTTTTNYEGEPLSRPVSQRQQDLLLVGEAVEASLPLAEPGYVFTHRWLQEQFDLLPKPQDGDERERWHVRYLRLVDLWRAAMGSHHVPTDSQHSKGYVVLAAADATMVYHRQAFQAMTRGIATGLGRIQDWIDAQQLLPAQRQGRFDAMGRLRNMEHALKMARPRPPRLPVGPTLAAVPALTDPETPTGDAAQDE